jgi:glycosylphosphatidylinositol transamidase (GPIT) subunit GPI8
MSEFVSASYLILNNFTWKSTSLKVGDLFQVENEEEHKDIQDKPEIFSTLLSLNGVREVKLKKTETEVSDLKEETEVSDLKEETEVSDLKEETEIKETETSVKPVKKQRVKE